MSLRRSFNTDKVTAFFSLTQTAAKISFFDILSICSLQGPSRSVFLASNRHFRDRMSINRVFCGKSFFSPFFTFFTVSEKKLKNRTKIV